MIEPKPRQWLVIRNNKGDSYSLSKCARVTPSLVICFVKDFPLHAQDKRVGRSRVMYAGDEMACLTICGLLNHAAFECAQAHREVLEAYHRQVKIITTAGRQTLTAAE